MEHTLSYPLPKIISQTSGRMKISESFKLNNGLLYFKQQLRQLFSSFFLVLIQWTMLLCCNHYIYIYNNGMIDDQCMFSSAINDILSKALSNYLAACLLHDSYYL